MSQIRFQEPEYAISCVEAACHQDRCRRGYAGHGWVPRAVAAAETVSAPENSRLDGKLKIIGASPHILSLWHPSRCCTCWRFLTLLQCIALSAGVLTPG